MSRVKLNREGVGQVAKSPGMQRLINEAAEKIAENVRGQGITVGGFKGDPGDIPLPVKVSTQITDRARASVTIAHPAGQAVQAKHGALTKAAGQSGLDVRGDQ